jgi:KDO2-lipid IV(A) lauroyltransferase
MARFILGHALRSLGDRNSRVQRFLFLLDHAFFSLLLWLIRLLPPSPAARFGAGVGALLGPRFKKSRALDENLRIALPDLSPADRRAAVREAWANAGAVFAEFAHLEAIADPGSGRLETRILGDIAAFRDATKPAIFVLPHQANWEMSGAAIVGQGVPLTAVYSPPTNPFLGELLRRWRIRIGCELIARDESMRPMIKALSAGRSLGIVMDRRVDTGKPVTLFGHPKPTTLVPARLAIRYGHELVPVHVERLGPARFRVSFHAPVTVPAGEDELQQAQEMTEQLHRLFEQWIRQCPGSWFASKRLWPKDVYRDERAA